MTYRWTVRKAVGSNNTVIELLRDELRIGRFMVVGPPEQWDELPEILFIVYPSKGTEQEIFEQLDAAPELDERQRSILRRARPYLYLFERYPFPIDQNIYILAMNDDHRERLRQLSAAVGGQLYVKAAETVEKAVDELGLRPPSKN